MKIEITVGDVNVKIEEPNVEVEGYPNILSPYRYSSDVSKSERFLEVVEEIINMAIKANNTTYDN